MVQRSSLRRSGAGSKPLSSILRIDCRAGVGAKTAYIAPGSPWEKGYCENFNGRMRDELQNGDIFYAPRSPNHDRKIEKPRQHKTTPQCSGQLTTSARGHRTDGPTANDALTSNPDYSRGVAPSVIPQFLFECSRRIHVAVFSFMAGVMPPMPMLGRSLL